MQRAPFEQRSRIIRPFPPPIPPPAIHRDSLHSTHALSPISIATAVPSPPVKSADTAGHPVAVPPEHPDGPIPNNLGRPPFAPFPPLEPPRDEADVPRSNQPDTVVDPERQASMLLGWESVVQLKELVELREKDITKRINLKNGMRDIEFQWQHATKAQEGFMTACANMMSAFTNQTTDKAQLQSLHETWKQLQNLSGHIQSREMGFGMALNDLFQLENRLFLREEKFYERLQGIFGTGTFSDSDEEDYFGETDDFTTALSAPSSVSSATTRSVAHKYYSRVGDLNLLRERIFNVDSEHRRQKAMRDAQRVAGHRVQPPDKIFYKKFLDEKEAIVREYVLAKEKMEELMESCARQGVEVEPPNLPPFLDQSFRDEQEHSGPGDAEEIKPDRSLRLHRNSTGHRRIQSWVQSIQADKPTELDLEQTWVALAETTGPHTLGWTDQQVENYLPFPIYSHLKPPTFEMKSPTKSGNPNNIPRTRAEMFEDEAPLRRYSTPSCNELAVSRRYSAPALPTFTTYVRLRDGALDCLDEEVPNRSCKSYTQYPP
jgi:hypothetical protein